MTDEQNFRVRNRAIERLLKEIGVSIGAKMPEGYGFSLLIFSFGEGGDLFYISNAERSDMIASMREMIAKLEQEDAHTTTS